MSQLNFHHLRYFWAVAKEGNLTRAARGLHVSPSAMSAQIKQLESDLGQALFQRSGRSLVLTEAGQLAFTYADGIFAAGTELVEVLREGHRQERQVLRIGAVATASRNFQENLLRPLLARDDVDLVLASGSLPELLGRLRVHALDLVLCNQRVQSTATDPWRCRRIAQQAVSIVGHPDSGPFALPDDLARVPLLVPGPEHGLRASFDLWCERMDLRPRIRAEVDDMALLRLLARDANAVALLPTVVVQDELRTGRLVELAVLPELRESFYAVSVKRRYESPLVEELLARSESDLLAAPAS